MFRLRSWNQNIRRDFEIQSPKLLFAGEMLRRFACGAPLKERGQLILLIGADFVFRMRVEPGSVTSGDVQQEKFGRERVRRNVGITQSRNRSFECSLSVHAKSLLIPWLVFVGRGFDRDISKCREGLQPRSVCYYAADNSCCNRSDS